MQPIRTIIEAPINGHQVRITSTCDTPAQELIDWTKALEDGLRAEHEAKQSIPETRTQPAADFALENHGSVQLLRPQTVAGQQWLQDHMPADAQYLGSAIAIHPRYLAPIIDGLVEDGLSYE